MIILLQRLVRRLYIFSCAALKRDLTIAINGIDQPDILLEKDVRFHRNNPCYVIAQLKYGKFIKFTGTVPKFETTYFTEI